MKFLRVLLTSIALLVTGGYHPGPWKP